MMIDETLVNNLAGMYKFKVKVFKETSTILVDSGDDEWEVLCLPKSHSNNRNIVLYHKNNKRDKKHSHLQRRYLDLEFCFKSIHTHKYKPYHAFDNAFRIQTLIDRVCCGK